MQTKEPRSNPKVKETKTLFWDKAQTDKICEEESRFEKNMQVNIEVVMVQKKIQENYMPIKV